MSKLLERCREIGFPWVLTDFIHKIIEFNQYFNFNVIKNSSLITILFNKIEVLTETICQKGKYRLDRRNAMN